jgi:lipoprotein-anchoring transpeptidase ErfK/SrfK
LTKLFCRPASRLGELRRTLIIRIDKLSQAACRNIATARELKSSDLAAGRRPSRWTMLKHAYLLPAAAAIAIATSPAQANVVVSIDKGSQTMSVSVDGQPSYRWAVSTARSGYSTPSGVYHPQRLERSHFSKLYYNSPMPYSIFFHGGYAIHGSYEINRLGGPASHGCVRLHPSNAATLYALVSREGMGATTIVIH